MKEDDEKMKNKLASPIANAKKGLSSILASVICIAIGLAVGYLLLMLLAWLALNQEVAEGIRASYTFDDLIQIVNDTGFMRMIEGGFYEGANLGGMGVRREIVETAPLIMTGLSVAFAFKTGLFNIGAAGQFTLGAYGALYSALILQLPWWACLLIATLCGALWGAIPGIFKAFLNVNEVITSIMVNWIGLYGVNTLMYQKGQGAMYNLKTTKTWTIATKNPDGLIPTFNIKNGDGTDYFMEVFGLPSIAIFIAIAVAILIWFIISKTTFGYELKACGHNKDAAKYAGINEKKNIILSMVIAGALAGLGADQVAGLGKVDRDLIGGGGIGLGILENEGDVLAFDKAFLGKTGDETGIAVIQRRMCGKLRHTDGDHIVSHGGGGEGEQHCDRHQQGNDLAGDSGLRHGGVPSFLFSSHLVSSPE